ncbi:mph1, partial [Symbiodinium sp. CCMP2456]
VMEEGQMDLGRLLQAEADITLGEVQVLWKQMLEAVQVVHSERVVHSDLKPGNFLLVKQSLKLIDFGIAKRIASNTTNISRESSVGTISYMAPEAVKQGAVKMGRPSDIWSLGIILYQMVYMKAPFAHLDPMQRLFALTATRSDQFGEEGW